MANDYERGNAWRYRDYVVRSFNQDKAYDQFIREQIAGDELDPENPEMLVAVGFLRMGPWELTGMEVAKLARQRFLDDVTDSVGQVFLSHPLQCARCHDHKFDPIPTRDYYRVQAAFATTQLAERRADFLPSENTRGFEQRQYFERRLARLQQIQRALGEKERRAAMAWAETRGFDYIPRSEGLAKGVPEERLAPRKVGFEIRDYGMERIARKGQERLRWILERYEPFALSVFTGKTPNRKSVSRPTRMPAEPLAKGTLEKTAILTGGDPFSPAETVVPGGLSVLPDYGVRFPKGIQGRRLALADWIAHPQNPLMARSLVNRVWQWHFGRGLAGHANNFGATGKRPTHPELLDWLAAVFVEDGFSLKKLHRRIVLSEAYRRASAGITAMADRTLGTSLYGAFEPRRLMAEEIWDSMLAISGELNLVVGGIPSKPEMNLEAAMQPRMVMGTFAEAWQPAAKPQDRHRRALYTLRLRGHQDPFLEVLNAPTNDLSCEAREPSTVSTQAFGLLNGDFTNGRAIALAARLRELDLTREATIVRLYQDVLGREPTSKEIELCLDHWSAMENRHKAIEHKPRAYPREIRRRAVEENTGEKFDYVEVLDFYSDFEPDRQRSDLDAETNGLADVCLVLLNANEFVYLY